MKGPRYILKKVHLEQCQMEEYKSHLKRMDEIKKNHNKQFKIQVEMATQIQELRQRHIQRDSQHRESEIQREQQRENQVRQINKKLRKHLVNKIMFINKRDSGFPMKKRMKSRISERVNRSHPNVEISSYSVNYKREQQEIQKKNRNIVDRLSELPPIINKKQFDQEYREHRERERRIRKFHKQQKDKNKKKQNESKSLIQYRVLPLFDEKNSELSKEMMKFEINALKIEIFSLSQSKDDSYGYLYEIKISNRLSKHSEEYNWDKFSKFKINDEMSYEELKSNRNIYIGLYQKWKDMNRFIGDFQIDVIDYFIKNGSYDLNYEIRSIQNDQPNYVQRDKRVKGKIRLNLTIQSQFFQYLLPMEEQTEERYKNPDFFDQFNNQP